MKVKELLEKLRDFDPDQDLICYCEDEGLMSPGKGFQLFEISNIELVEAEKIRIEDDVPSLKIGKTERSIPHVLIEITSDF